VGQCYWPLTPGTGDVGNFDGTLALLHELLDDEAPRPTSFENYYTQLRNKIEALGVLVMRNSVVGNNVHRRLDRNELRGFAISDDRAPVIFINTTDTPQAQIFTLLHEFAHLLLGESGVSDLSPHNPRKIERACNRLAAEFLVPSADFSELWRKDLKIRGADGTEPSFNRLIKARYGNRLPTAIIACTIFPRHHKDNFLGGADPWLIAMAKVSGAKVVTHEEPVPPGLICKN